MKPSPLPDGNNWCDLRGAFSAALRYAVWLLLALSVTAAPAGSSPEPAAAAPLRIGIVPAMVLDRYDVLEDWRAYLQSKLKRPVEFLAPGSYGEAVDLIEQKRLDFAWVSAYSYVLLRRSGQVRLLATPVYRGRPTNRAYLIVAATDRQTRSLLQLEGKVFVYSNTYSFAGYLLPQFELRQAGRDAGHFFGRSFFAHLDQHVVEAVAQGLADAGWVDGFAWDSIATAQPALAAQTRVAAKSAEYGFAPLVARAHANLDATRALRQVLLAMADDAEGARLLLRLHVDRFVAGSPKLYDGVARATAANAMP